MIGRAEYEMNAKVDELLGRIQALQDELEQEWDKGRERFHYHLEQRRVRFEQQILEAHRRFRTSLPRFVARAKLRDLILAPVIYLMVLPLGLLDLTLWLYQVIYFRAYAIPRVPRDDFVVFDRHQLAYLNGIEKLNCLYCSYANGLFAYAREIGARTEQYWCPIKHAQRIHDCHGRYNRFIAYGDAEAYRRELPRVREALTRGQG